MKVKLKYFLFFPILLLFLPLMSCGAKKSPIEISSTTLLNWLLAKDYLVPYVPETENLSLKSTIVCDNTLLNKDQWDIDSRASWYDYFNKVSYVMQWIIDEQNGMHNTEFYKLILRQNINDISKYFNIVDGERNLNIQWFAHDYSDPEKKDIYKIETIHITIIEATYQYITKILNNYTSKSNSIYRNLQKSKFPYTYQKIRDEILSFPAEVGLIFTMMNEYLPLLVSRGFVIN